LAGLGPGEAFTNPSERGAWVFVSPRVGQDRPVKFLLSQGQEVVGCTSVGENKLPGADFSKFYTYVLVRFYHEYICLKNVTNL
jgi:hypothetical protein